MIQSIEDIIRRIVREELAAEARKLPHPYSAPSYVPACTCYQGGSPTSVCPLHGGRDPYRITAQSGAITALTSFPRSARP